MLRINKGLLIVSAALLLAGCSNNAPQKKEKLVVLTNPTKTEYSCGNNFDKSGLTLEYTDTEGNKTTITDFTLSNDKNLKYTQSTVTAKYKDLSVEVDITMRDVVEGQLTCIGDSLTQGHYWPSESYPNFIGNNSDKLNLNVVNCGKDGASFKNFGQYNPKYQETTQYNTSLTGNPIVLTILLGTNDATNWDEEKDLYVQDYTNLVETYRTTFGEDLNIVMITSPRCISPNQFGIPTDIICNEVVPLQKRLAEDLNCYLIDLNAEFENYSDSELFRPNDDVHLTKQAATITAKLIEDKILSIYEIE